MIIALNFRLMHGLDAEKPAIEIGWLGTLLVQITRLNPVWSATLDPKRPLP
jgi:hypothetical protein